MEEPKHGKQARVKKVSRKKKFRWEKRKNGNYEYSNKGGKDSTIQIL